MQYESTNTLVDMGGLIIREARPQRPRPPGPDTKALAVRDYCAPISPAIKRRLRNLAAAILLLLQFLMWLSLVPWSRSPGMVIGTSRLTLSALGWLAYLLPAVAALQLLARRPASSRPEAGPPPSGLSATPGGRLVAIWFMISVLLEIAAPGGGGGVVGAAVLTSLRVLTGVPAVATLLALAGAASAGWWVVSGLGKKPGLDRTRSEPDSDLGLQTVPISCVERPAPFREPTDRQQLMRIRKVSNPDLVHRHPVQVAAKDLPSARPDPIPEIVPHVPIPEPAVPHAASRAEFGEVVLAR